MKVKVIACLASESIAYSPDAWAYAVKETIKNIKEIFPICDNFFDGYQCCMVNVHFETEVADEKTLYDEISLFKNISRRDILTRIDHCEIKVV